MKYIKLFEEKYKPFHGKDKPKHKYDCENCKFNWCCGFSCTCKLNLPEPPEDSLYVTSKKYNV
jgi:hypothetical protein